MSDKLTLGQWGEQEAVRFLRKAGYRVLERNVRTPLGEIDIVARQGGVLVFVEVRTRRGAEGICRALESVDAGKQRRLDRLALWYLKEKNLSGCRARFDVVAVCQDAKGSSATLIRDAFQSPGRNPRL